MVRSASFIPAQPPRVPQFLPTWRGLFGERLRSIVHGIAEPAFDLPYVRRKFLNMQLHVVNDPDMVGHVLLNNQSCYVRPRLTRQILSSLIGNGLLNAEGEDWRMQRRLVAPSFSPASVERAAQLMTDATTQQMHNWPDQRKRMDMAQIATQTAAAIIAKTLFSDDPRLISPVAARHIEQVLATAGQPRLLTMLGLSNWDPSPSMLRARRSRLYLRTTLENMVQERCAASNDDFFGGLIRAFHADMPPGEANALAVDNAITFYVAGHETTATTLSWAAYLFAAQPDLQEKLRIEAIEALNGERALLPERVPLLRQFLDETLRLYPAAAQLVREAAWDDDICGIPVKKGELIMIYPWILHRHRKLWNEPDAFDIDRFSVEGKATQHRFQYIPFGAGPRICVGARFAITEALIILAHWLAARRFILPKGFGPVPYGTVTLRPKNGMPLLMEPI
jgi:cytochrome P450